MTRAEQRQEWETRIAAYRSSGQSAKEWCATNGVKPERLWYRLRQASYGKLAVEEGRFWEELTENGALGDATLATAELGKEVIEVALDRLTEFLRRFMES